MKTIYKGDTRYEKVYEQMQLLGIQDVSTERQVKNGTIVWRLPILSDAKGKYLEYASFASGYVRNQGVDCHSNWQCNKRIPSDGYYPEYKWVDGYQVKTGKYLKWTTRTCELIPIEIDRLEYMMKYIIKNEFIKRANTVQQGNFVPKWKYEHELKNRDAIADVVFPEKTQSVQVIVDGHKYKVI
jgi:hypothetical protein